jgi:diguanylate cyclase (GGDEF)-like protein
MAVGAAVASITRRPADCAIRYGGEELIILLPDTDAAGTKATAERARQAISALEIIHRGSPYSKVTASVGWTTSLDTNIDRRIDTIITAADKALYISKTTGRNKVTPVD